MRKLIPLLALLSTLAFPAVAQESNCAPYDQVEAMLAAEYQETRVSQGVGDKGSHMLAIFASANGATWTAVTLSPEGIACLVDAGTDWQVRSDPAPVPETGL